MLSPGVAFQKFFFCHLAPPLAAARAEGEVAEALAVVARPPKAVARSEAEVKI